MPQRWCVRFLSKVKSSVTTVQEQDRPVSVVAHQERQILVRLLKGEFDLHETGGDTQKRE